MAHQLSFDLKHAYDTRHRGITLEVILGAEGQERRVTAKVDTGAALIYFAEEESFSRNVLGQRGWLDHMRLGILDYEGLLYLSGYSQ